MLLIAKGGGDVTRERPSHPVTTYHRLLGRVLRLLQEAVHQATALLLLEQTTARSSRGEGREGQDDEENGGGTAHLG